MPRFAILLGIVAATVALTAATASADAPTRVQFTTHGTSSFAAGELCDFAYYEDRVIEHDVFIFGDPDNPTRVTEHATAFITHVNVDTGYTLTEVDQNTREFNSETERFKIVGLFTKLVDANGKLVHGFVDAGQMLFDTSTGELIKFTPNINPDFADVVCTALGGSPAI